jgi:hypothetical protein
MNSPPPSNPFWDGDGATNNALAEALLSTLSAMPSEPLQIPEPPVEQLPLKQVPSLPPLTIRPKEQVDDEEEEEAHDSASSDSESEVEDESMTDKAIFASLIFPDGVYNMMTEKLWLGRDPIAYRVASYRDKGLFHQTVTEEEFQEFWKALLATENDNYSTAECPVLWIHPPKQPNTPLPSGSDISRQHAKIEYNHRSGSFQMTCYGRNGLQINKDRFGREHGPQPLRFGDVILVQDVQFLFQRPPNGEDSDTFETSSSRDDFLQHVSPHVGYEDAMEYDIGTDQELLASNEEDDDDEDDDESSEEDQTPTTSRGMKGKAFVLRKGQKLAKYSKGKDGPSKSEKLEKVKKMPKIVKKLPKSPKTPKFAKEEEESDSSPDDDKSQEGSDGEKKDASPGDKSSAPRVARDAPLINGEDVHVPGLPQGAIIPARSRRPGRPPKDGVLSKRERQQIVKEYREREKAEALGLDPASVISSEPKKTARTRKNSRGQDIQDDAEAGDGNDQERKKADRPPKSNLPEMKLEDYTEEQLQRPTENYAQMIHKVVSDSGKPMNLQQIYDAMERKWPFFKFRVGTVGWQSSVRHNLAQHAAFLQVEKDGKGWFWGIDPAVPIEKEPKKPRTTSMPQSYHHPHGQMYPPAQGYYHGQPNGMSPQSGMHQRYPQTSQNPPMQTANRPPTFGTMFHHPPGARPAAPANQQFGQNQRTQAPLQRPAPAAGAARPANPSNGTAGQRSGSGSRPAQDVIDMFVSVFLRTYLANTNNKEDHESAQRLVNNAIERVMNPESLAHVPISEREQSVIDAFKLCLSQSNGATQQTGGGTGSNASSGPATPGATPTPAAGTRPMFRSTPGVPEPQPFTTRLASVGARTPTPTGVSGSGTGATSGMSYAPVLARMPITTSGPSRSASATTATHGSAAGTQQNSTASASPSTAQALNKPSISAFADGSQHARATTATSLTTYQPVMASATAPTKPVNGLLNQVMATLSNGSNSTGQSSNATAKSRPRSSGSIDGPTAPPVEPLTPPPPSSSAAVPAKRHNEGTPVGNGEKKARLG